MKGRLSHLACCLLIFGLLVPVGELCAQETVTVGVLGIRPGSAGRSFDQGAAIALDVINGRGKTIFGRELATVFEDAGGTPEKATAALEKMIQRHGAVLTVVGPHAFSALAVASLAEAYHHPVIVVEAPADLITAAGFRYVFRAGPSNSGLIAEALVGFVRAQALRRIALVTEETDFGRGVRAITLAALQTLECEVLSLETLRAAVDSAALQEAVAAFHPELVVSFVYGLDGRVFLGPAPAAAASWTPPLVMNGLQLFDDGPPAEMGVGGARMLVPTRLHLPREASGVAGEFHRAYRERFHKEVHSCLPRALFDALLIAADALRRAGSADAEALVQALEETELTVAAGTVRFGREAGSYRHHHWQPPTFILQHQDSAMAVVHPPAWADSRLQR
jgi:branched-chain amino acid transport system substrate-binding protein